ncbi:unnamed protein product [Trichobilharzia regenti]|nr:unnamed protein product [Trichobilharzia regenti]
MTSDISYNNSNIRRTESAVFIDEVLRHVATKQLLFLETHVCTIYRVVEKNAAGFQENKALRYLNKYHKKRQAHCNACLLEDRLCLQRIKSSGKVPFRPWVSYKDIMNFFKSTGRPEFFVLYVCSNQKYVNYYEIYKCKTSDNVKRIEDLLMKAFSDPDKILRDVNALKYVTLPSQPAREVNLEDVQVAVQGSNDVFEVNGTKDPINSEEKVPEVETSPLLKRKEPVLAAHNVVTSPTPHRMSLISKLQTSQVNPPSLPHSPVLMQKVSSEAYEDDFQVVPLSRVEENYFDEPSPVLLSFSRYSATVSPEVEMETSISDILDNVSFIDFDPHEGLFPCNKGPIYMFLARQEFHLNNAARRGESPVERRRKYKH